MKLPYRSALYATGCIAAHQFVDVGDRHPIEIATDRMLEATGRDCEFEGLPAIMCGIFGYVIGTFIGVTVAAFLG